MEKTPHLNIFPLLPSMISPDWNMLQLLKRKIKQKSGIHWTVRISLCLTLVVSFYMESNYEGRSLDPICNLYLYLLIVANLVVWQFYFFFFCCLGIWLFCVQGRRPRPRVCNMIECKWNLIFHIFSGDWFDSAYVIWILSIQCWRKFVEAAEKIILLDIDLHK